MLSDPARELPVLVRPIARSYHGEASAIQQVLRTDTIKEWRGCLAEIPFQTFRIAAIATTDHPEAAPLPSLDDERKGGASLQQRRNTIGTDIRSPESA
jgi:hypothetical protein